MFRDKIQLLVVTTWWNILSTKQIYSEKYTCNKAEGSMKYENCKYRVDDINGWFSESTEYYPFKSNFIINGDEGKGRSI